MIVISIAGDWLISAMSFMITVMISFSIAGDWLISVEIF